MPRALFEKKGNSIFISHLDLMRLFQRAFKRAGLPLKHTQGYNPRPSVSIALPLSLGIESGCELLDFELDGAEASCEEIRRKLNGSLVEGVRVLEVYEDAARIRHLALLDCDVTLEYDGGIPENAVSEIKALFAREDVTVEKKGKNGIQQQNIIPMIRSLEIFPVTPRELRLSARICCQNPTLNPMQLAAAIECYLPECRPDFVRCCRVEVYDINEKIFR